MNKIRKLPVGIQNFEKIIKEGYIYVDKTEYIQRLVSSGSVYFLSRPRRFGKSLLISTLEAYFQGKRELFEGLKICEYEDARGEEAWQEYPVIRFSLSGGNYNAADGLSVTLKRVLENAANEFGVVLADLDLPNQFAQLLQDIPAKTGRQVVVLVDEYDKPLLETMIVNEEQEEKNRQLYKGFFSVLKDQDQYLKFVFFTGVTKFSKVSIFSDLNQLEDISLSDDFSGICGITESELADYFQPEIVSIAEDQNIDCEEYTGRLADMYDGYHFSPKGIGVYNPYSLLRSFKDKRLRRYWFETGTPVILVRKLSQSPVTAEQLTDGVQVTESSLTDYRLDNPDPLPLFYQTGYLTIRGFDEEFQVYKLGFPNNEVKYGFLESLIQPVLGEAAAGRGYSVMEMVLDLRKGDIDSFMNRIEAVFSTVPYAEGQQHPYENEWRNEIFLTFQLMGMNAGCEVHTAAGRADCVVETGNFVYIFEFKLDKSADEALQQIEDRGYAGPYMADTRKVIEIGVNFSSDKRNIEEWKVK